jgi:urea transport system substrate-binding protein
MADFNVAFVVPRSGPAGIFGPSSENCGRLAAEEINAESGVRGRKLRLVHVDGGQEPHVVAGMVDRLISRGQVQAVAGWHTSAVREKIAPRTSWRVPYVYTALYEGLERTPGVFLTGETPHRQVFPALRWMSRELGVRRWFIVGNDYVWPRASARSARRYAGACAGEICGESFLPLDTEEFGPTLRLIERSKAQGVLMFLVGMDAVRFNRAFTQMRLDDHCVRFSPLMEENMLLATGSANTKDLYAAAGFFEMLATAECLDFSLRYHRRFGVNAPVLNSPGESCYEGLTLLARLASQSASLDMPDICASADTGSVFYDGPRGALTLQHNHLAQHVYLARAEGAEFDVIAQLTDDP